MKRVEIDSKILEEPKEVKRQEPSEKPVTLEKEIPAMEQSSRQVKDAPKGTLPSPLSPMTVETFETPSGVDAEKPLLPEAESLFGKEVSRDTIGDAPELMIPDTKKTTAARSGKTEKFTSLDDLLTGEPIKGQVPPILMPTDLLFEYDSDALKPEAAVTLSKLGNLIQKNATSGFRIEGHTDSFGSDLYNDGLSLRRAEAVKKWLQDTMGLPGNRITTIGLGKSRLLVPPSASVAEQQLNRRVEIIMSLPESTEKGH